MQKKRKHDFNITYHSFLVYILRDKRKYNNLLKEKRLKIGYILIQRDFGKNSACFQAINLH